MADELRWNDTADRQWVHDMGMKAVEIIGPRVRDEAIRRAPRMRSRPPGRGSFPRVPPGYLAAHITDRYGTDPGGFPYAEVGSDDPAAAVLIRFRGGLGGEGAYGGTRRRDPFLIDAIDSQIGRDI